MPKILVVDDDSIVQKTLQRALNRDDMVVTIASTAIEALEILKNEQFELIVTDVKMPEMDGITFLKRVKTDNPQIPIIVVTGFATVEMTKEALQNGAFNFITKPFEIQNILDIVKKGLSAQKEVIRNKEVAAFAQCEFNAKIPSRGDLLNGVIFCLIEQAKLLNFSPRIISTEILMALDEALTNAHKHGNKGDTNKNIVINLKSDSNTMRILVRDEGEGFSPDKLINPLSAEGMEKNCGRGVWLIKTYMDEVSFNDKGNEVIMVKHNKK